MNKAYSTKEIKDEGKKKNMELESEDKYSSLTDDVLVQTVPPPTKEVTEILFLALTRSSVPYDPKTPSSLMTHFTQNILLH